MSGFIATGGPEVWPAFRDLMVMSPLELVPVHDTRDIPHYQVVPAVRAPRPSELLTPHQMSVLMGMSRGLANREIGEGLYITEHTVKTVARALFRKLGARDRAHAVHIAHLRGLLGGVS